MHAALHDLSYKIFYETAQSSIDVLDFTLSDKIEFPKIEYTTKCHVIVPTPRQVGETYFFEGNVFDNYDESHNTIWSLYLATIYHIGAHAKVTDYTKYENWMKGKTPEKCWKVIDSVEEINVEVYLKKSFPDAWKNMTKIKTIFQELYNKKIQKNSKKYAKNKFANYYFDNNPKQVLELKKKLSTAKDLQISEILPALDFLYKNEHLLPENILPYCKHNDCSITHKNLIKNVIIQPKGEFERMASNLDELWITENNRKGRLLKRYQKFANDSNFDEIEVSPENFGEFERIYEEGSADLQRLRTSLRSFSNILDAPELDEYGLVDLQMAIQRKGSQNDEIQIFEQGVSKMESENWVVVIDSSGSTISKFEEMKRFAMCLAETANTISQRGGTWGLYSFNNNFFIVKDHVEKYSQRVKARIGGLKNKGLSFVPDAIKMGVKILENDSKSAHKYLIIMTDGQSLGYANMEKGLQRSLEYAKKKGVNVIGIGIPNDKKELFSFTVDDTDLKKGVKKFMKSYSHLVQQQMNFRI